MISTLLFLTFLSMAVGAPQRATSRQVAEGPLKVAPPVSVASVQGSRPAIHTEGIVDSTAAASFTGVPQSKIQIKQVRVDAPPSEDLLGQYIFTTYHLLLKEIRNEAGDTEIVAVKQFAGPLTPLDTGLSIMTLAEDPVVLPIPGGASRK